MLASASRMHADDPSALESKTAVSPICGTLPLLQFAGLLKRVSPLSAGLDQRIVSPDNAVVKHRTARKTNSENTLKVLISPLLKKPYLQADITIKRQEISPQTNNIMK
jgi:hypothetical protein